MIKVSRFSNFQNNRWLSDFSYALLIFSVLFCCRFSQKHGRKTPISRPTKSNLHIRLNRKTFFLVLGTRSEVFHSVLTFAVSSNSDSFNKTILFSVSVRKIKFTVYFEIFWCNEWFFEAMGINRNYNCCGFSVTNLLSLKNGGVFLRALCSTKEKH